MTTEFDIPVLLKARNNGDDREAWSEALAERLAAEDGLGPLTEQQWQVITTLREHYLRFGTVPSMRYVCDLNHLDPHCVTSLFHDSREAWRIAGVNHPGEEAWSYS